MKATVIHKRRNCVVTGCKANARHWFFIMGDHYPVCNVHLDRNVPPSYKAFYRGPVTPRKLRTFFRYLGRLNYRPGIDVKPLNRVKNRIGPSTAWDIATIVHDHLEYLQHDRRADKDRDLRPGHPYKPNSSWNP